MKRVVLVCVVLSNLANPISVLGQESSSAEKIRNLEQQLEQQRNMIAQQQEMLERMQQELDALKADNQAGQTSAEVAAATPDETVEASTDTYVMTSAPR